jgi:hypothetical protein
VADAEVFEEIGLEVSFGTLVSLEASSALRNAL